jgi:hypothetical protein
LAFEGVGENSSAIGSRLLLENRANCNDDAGIPPLYS